MLLVQQLYGSNSYIRHYSTRTLKRAPVPLVPRLLACSYRLRHRRRGASRGCRPALATVPMGERQAVPVHRRPKVTTPVMSRAHKKQQPYPPYTARVFKGGNLPFRPHHTVRTCSCRLYSRLFNYPPVEVVALRVSLWTEAAAPARPRRWRFGHIRPKSAVNLSLAASMQAQALSFVRPGHHRRQRVPRDGPCCLEALAHQNLIGHV